jgi:hypothetical protein
MGIRRKENGLGISFDKGQELFASTKDSTVKEYMWRIQCLGQNVFLWQKSNEQAYTHDNSSLVNVRHSWTGNRIAKLE